MAFISSSIFLTALSYLVNDMSPNPPSRLASASRAAGRNACGELMTWAIVRMSATGNSRPLCMTMQVQSWRTSDALQ